MPITRLTWLLCAVALLLAARAAPAQNAELAAALRQGGFVIYFRHADTGAAIPDPPGIDLARCETQRNLNDNGRAEVAEIGRHFKRLGIPVGAVWSSQSCRCWQTAQLAFGRYELDSLLTGVPRGPEHEAARHTASDHLRKVLGTAPLHGENTVLVSHGFNLIDLEGLYLSTQGEAAIYRPDGSGGYQLVARVRPDEWAAFPSPAAAPITAVAVPAGVRVQQMLMTEADIDSGLIRDLYVSLGEPAGDRAWVVRVYHKPFVGWIWGGCLLMALGVVIAVSDRRYRLAAVERPLTDRKAATAPA